ncbi:MAG TPA: ATP synthase F0 subunit B [Holophaga sp.]|nr:ATP synthase F0 subunit B [Holophaga sp.]
MIFDLMAALVNVGLAGSEGEASGGVIDSLPDPMKPQIGAVLFVIAVLVVLFIFLKHILFKPLTRLMDDREAAIKAGGASKNQAATEIEARQKDYESKLAALRAQAGERRKALTSAASDERRKLVEDARQKASTQREEALAELKAGQQVAKTDLLTQVETLSESMVQHLLNQA